MIQFVFLDLDDTLLDFHRSEEVAIRKTVKTLADREIGDDVIQLYRRINEGYWKKLEKGEITRDELRVARFEEFFAAIGLHPSAQMAKTVYERALGTGHYFIDGAPNLLMNLSKKYSLYLASNGTASVQNSRIESSGIARYFKGIFISEVIGVNKPDRAYFDACFATIPNFDPAKAIILGDSLTSDIKGGLNAGILTCRFNPTGAPGREDIRPHFEISKLSQFPTLLEQINAQNA